MTRHIPGLETMSRAQVRFVEALEELRNYQEELRAQNLQLCQIQQELEEQKDRYYALFESGPMAYFLCDRRGHILEANSLALRLLSDSPAPLETRGLAKLAVPYDRDRVRTHLQNALDQGQAQCEVSLLQRSPERGVCRVHMVSRLLEANIMAPRVLVAALDVTTQYQVAEALAESEQRYRTLFERAGDGVFLVNDSTETIQDVNENGARLLGYTPIELRGTSVRDLTPVEEHPQMIGQMEHLRAEGSLLAETNLCTRTGGRVPVEISSRLLTLNHQRLVLAISRDLTDRKEVQRRLEEEAEKLRLLIEENPMTGAYLIQHAGPDDPTPVFRYANPTLARIVGRSPECMRDLPVADVLKPENREMVLARLEQRLSGEVRTASYHTTIQRPDGTEVVAEIHGTRTDLKGVPTVVGLLRDVTGRITQEREMRESEIARLTAENAAQAKAELLANVSHELRTPIMTIRGHAETIGRYIDKDADPALIQKKLKRLLANVDRLHETIEDVLDLARGDSGRMPFAPDWANLAALFRENRHALQGRLEEAQLGFRMVDEECLRRVWCDARLMKRVIQNLFSNAVKFASTGSTLIVRGRLTEAGGVQAILENEGTPIPEADLERIFRSFEQSSATDNGSGSTGLGLALCHQVMVRHGGRIHAECRPGTDWSPPRQAHVVSMVLTLPPIDLVPPPDHADGLGVS